MSMKLGSVDPRSLIGTGKVGLLKSTDDIGEVVVASIREPRQGVAAVATPGRPVAHGGNPIALPAVRTLHHRRTRLPDGARVIGHYRAPEVDGWLHHLSAVGTSNGSRGVNLGEGRRPPGSIPMPRACRPLDPLEGRVLDGRLRSGRAGNTEP